MTTGPDTSGHAPPAVTGRTWRELPAGTVFRTGTRTITEFDLMQFVTLAGFMEPLFVDASVNYAENTPRLVPAALTLAIAEGLVVQTHTFAGTGIAFLGMELTAPKPVTVGDTLYAVVEITESRATRTAERGLVGSIVDVYNQGGEQVLQYMPTRLVRTERPGQ